MARSDEPNDEYYWRMTPFQLPSFTNIPGGVPVLTAAVPMDDTHMWGFSIRWDFDKPIEEPAMDMDVDPVTFLPLANHSNDYLRDLQLQKEGNFTGITGIRLQDVAVQEDQDGPICRRHEEHLGTTRPGDRRRTPHAPSAGREAPQQGASNHHRAAQRGRRTASGQSAR